MGTRNTGDGGDRYPAPVNIALTFVRGVNPQSANSHPWGSKVVSAPPPYQNQPQQQYGYQQQPQAPYGQPQQPYGQPQPPRRPQPQRSPLRGLITAVILLALFGGVGYYVYDYNTNPNGGKAKEEADRKAYDRKHTPQVGDCVKITGPKDDSQMTVVACDSSDAQYKTGETHVDGKACGPEYTTVIHQRRRLGLGTTWCFTKV